MTDLTFVTLDELMDEIQRRCLFFSAVACLRSQKPKVVGNDGANQAVLAYHAEVGYEPHLMNQALAVVGEIARGFGMRDSMLDGIPASDSCSFFLRMDGFRDVLRRISFPPDGADVRWASEIAARALLDDVRMLERKRHK